MAISTCFGIPRILPGYSSFSCSKKANEHYTNVALIRSERVSRSIPFPQAKPSRTAFEILTGNYFTSSFSLKASTRAYTMEQHRTISEENDVEIQSQINRLQNACEKSKEFLGDIILVLMAINPLLQGMSDAIAANNHFYRWSYIGASYGALVMLKECVKIFCKSKPIRLLIILGFLIYKANMWNIALYKNNRYPVWLGIPLTVLLYGKFTADVTLLLFVYKLTPSNVILGSIDILASASMIIYLSAAYISIKVAKKS